VGNVVAINHSTASCGNLFDDNYYQWYNKLIDNRLMLFKLQGSSLEARRFNKLAFKSNI